MFNEYLLNKVKDLSSNHSVLKIDKCPEKLCKIFFLSISYFLGCYMIKNIHLNTSDHHIGIPNDTPYKILFSHSLVLRITLVRYLTNISELVFGYEN